MRARPTMARFRRFGLHATLAAGLVWTLAGCAQGPLSAAASMRVEVEVYKGPLSKEPETQWGELKALIKEASNTLTLFNDGLVLSASFEGFVGDSNGKKLDLKLKAPTWPDAGTFGDQRVVTQLPTTPSSGGVGDPEGVLEFCEKSLPDIQTSNQVSPDTYVSCLIMAQIRDDVSQLLDRIRTLEAAITADDLERLDGLLADFAGALRVHGDQTSYVVASVARAQDEIKRAKRQRERVLRAVRRIEAVLAANVEEDAVANATGAIGLVAKELKELGSILDDVQTVTAATLPALPANVVAALDQKAKKIAEAAEDVFTQQDDYLLKARQLGELLGNIVATAKKLGLRSTFFKQIGTAQGEIAKLSHKTLPEANDVGVLQLAIAGAKSNADDLKSINATRADVIEAITDYKTKLLAKLAEARAAAIRVAEAKQTRRTSTNRLTGALDDAAAAAAGLQFRGILAGTSAAAGKLKESRSEEASRFGDNCEKKPADLARPGGTSFCVRLANITEEAEALSLPTASDSLKSDIVVLHAIATGQAGKIDVVLSTAKQAADTLIAKLKTALTETNRIVALVGTSDGGKSLTVASFNRAAAKAPLSINHVVTIANLTPGAPDQHTVTAISTVAEALGNAQVLAGATASQAEADQVVKWLESALRIAGQMQIPDLERLLENLSAQLKEATSTEATLDDTDTIDNQEDVLRALATLLGNALGETTAISDGLGRPTPHRRELLTSALSSMVDPLNNVLSVREHGIQTTKAVAERLADSLKDLVSEAAKLTTGATPYTVQLGEISEGIKSASQVLAQDDPATDFSQAEAAAKALTADLVLDLAGEGLGKERLRGILVKAAEVATIFKIKALYWAEVHVSAAPGSRITRASMVNFANLASEYSNQIGGRADALLKQLSGEGRPRQELPTSVYLRDAPTDFLKLYTWNRAVAPALIEDMILHPLNSFTSEETTDRVRVIERLFADHNWTKINTVYGSGQGDVRMALIKDDIGNWNLKSFSSDPSKLVEAYTELTIAGIDAATKAVKAGLTGGSSAALDAALDTASQLTQGSISGGSSAGGFNVEALHERAAAKLNDLKTRAETKEIELSNERDTKKVAADGKVAEAQTAMAKVETTKQTHPKVTDVPTDLKTDDATARATAAETASIAAEQMAESTMTLSFKTSAQAELLEMNATASAGHVQAKAAREHAEEAVEQAKEALRSADSAKSKARSALAADDPANSEIKKTDDSLATEAQVNAINADRATTRATALQKAAEANLDAANKLVEAAAASNAIAEHRKSVLTEAQGILDDHATIIDVLQEGATMGSAPPAPAQSDSGDVALSVANGTPESVGPVSGTVQPDQKFLYPTIGGG